MNYGQFVTRHAAQRPHDIAVIFGERRISYVDFDGSTNRLANIFADLGLSRGARVAILSENGPLPFETMVGCVKAGLIYLPLDYRATAAELAVILQDATPEVVIIGLGQETTGNNLRAEAAINARWLAAGSTRNFEELEGHLARSSEFPRDFHVSECDGFCILYTSGTTGRPKGVLLTHGETIANAEAVIAAYEIDAETKYILSYPHHSTGGVNHISGPVFMAGGTLIVSRASRFEPEEFLTTIERERATHVQLVPTALFRVLDFQRRGEFDLSSLRTFSYSSAPTPVARVRQMVAEFGPIFVQPYGMTETCSIATVLSKADHDIASTKRDDILASCGRPVPQVELKIELEDGNEAPTGVAGEIVMRAPWFTKGYWRDPVRTAELLRDGWLHTGDIGRRDAEGYVYIVDRKKDIIITGGYNVSSAEVEAVAYSHPAVGLAAVIGLPDPEWGERVHLIVVGKEGQTIASDEIAAYCRERLSPMKRPKTVEVRQSLPMTSTGKPAKAALRSERR